MWGVIGRVGVIFAIAIGAFATLEFAVHHHIKGLVPVIWDATSWDSPQTLAIILSYGIFASALWLTVRLKAMRSPLVQRLYVTLWNGGFFGVPTQRI